MATRRLKTQFHKPGRMSNELLQHMLHIFKMIMKCDRKNSFEMHQPTPDPNTPDAWAIE